MRIRHMWRAVAAALAITTLAATPTFAEEPEGQEASATTSTAAPSTTVPASPESDGTSAPTGSSADADSPAETSLDTSVVSSPDGSVPAPDDAASTSTRSTTTTPPTSATSTSLPAGDSQGGSHTSTTSSNTSESTTGTTGTTGSASSGSGQPTSTHETGHSVEITSIQVSVADTGNNSSTSSGASGGQPPVTTGSSQITTGSASAVGSRDSTQLVQQAITELTNGASAEIVQISIAFNIGAAVANSGTNALATGNGAASASITSGNATAIGNDSQTFVTQGAAASAGTAALDSAQQSTMVMHLGVARSNTGANTIIATVTSTGPAAIGTGDAAAIGNQSTTEIEQLAQAVGTNGGELTIRQRATVINLGLALADSGSNAIGGALAAAIDTGDSADFEQLLALILPELLRTALPATEAAGPNSVPSGSAATGDALAIGNRSTTAVQQVAVGAGDGGTVEIGQDVVVVNAGVASATTGRNAIGSEVATLDPESQVVVSQLAVFLSNLLDRIDAWSSGEEVELDDDSLSTSLGGLTIGLDSSVAANVLSGDAAAGATIRQLTAVINLAFALANTGHNTQANIAQSNTAAGVSTSGQSNSTLAVASVDSVGGVSQAVGEGVSTLIVTGNASATNSMILVVCQLSSVDLTCLGPETEEQEPPTTTSPPSVEEPVTPTPVATTTPAQPVPSQPGAGFDPVIEETPDPVTQPQPDAGRQGLLAVTGGEPATVLRIAAVLVLTGVVLSAATRRRVPRSSTAV